MESLRLAAEGKHDAAGGLRDRALEAAPATSGTIVTSAGTRSVSEGPTPQTETPFEWIADADSRLGPVLEAILNGRYYWVPLHRVKRIDVEPPADLRDVVWMPAHFVWANGGDTVALLPTRYHGSEQNADPLIRLARKTEWSEVAPGVFCGQGQRMLTADCGEFSLMDVRQVRLNVPDAPAAEGAAAKHG
jgi:type VI secretion system protein ImpE